MGGGCLGVCNSRAHIEIVDSSGTFRNEFTRNILARKGWFQEWFSLGCNTALGRRTVQVLNPVTRKIRFVSTVVPGRETHLFQPVLACWMESRMKNKECNVPGLSLYFLDMLSET